MGEDKSIKFLADSTVVKLGRWLRLLGFDTEIIKESTVERLKEKDGRVLLTRNRRLKIPEERKYLLIPEAPFRIRLDVVIRKFNLSKKIKPFTRCSLCNEILKEINKKFCKGKVPYYTYQTQDKFYICSKCKKLFWAGSHRNNFITHLSHFLPY